MKQAFSGPEYLDNACFHCFSELFRIIAFLPCCFPYASPSCGSSPCDVRNQVSSHPDARACSGTWDVLISIRAAHPEQLIFTPFQPAHFTAVLFTGLHPLRLTKLPSFRQLLTRKYQVFPLFRFLISVLLVFPESIVTVLRLLKLLLVLYWISYPFAAPFRLHTRVAVPALLLSAFSLGVRRRTIPLPFSSNELFFDPITPRTV